MSARMRWATLIVVVVLAVGAVLGVALFAQAQQQRQQSSPSSVETATPSAATGQRIVFRNTAPGQGYGHVASVPLHAPADARVVLDVACDRVAASATALACLRTERGIVPSYTATLYDPAGAEEHAAWSLPGVPSRTRFSPDGTLVATTAFVTGHAYASVGFSTATEIHRTDDGHSLGNLEDWSLIIDGAPSAPVDRNYWGITFIDDTSFYATASLTTVGRTYLVKGDLEARTLTSVADNVECPSLSPDGTRIAFKRVIRGAGPTVHWTPAIFDIRSGEVTVLGVETRSVDDQITWLDDETLLYGMPGSTAGDADVWALPAGGGQPPRVVIAHAWSPSIVREG